MNLLPALALQISGAAAASYLDHASPEPVLTLGNTAITKGAAAAVALGLAVAVLPLPGRTFLGMLAGGALVYEGAKLVEPHVLGLMGPAAVQGYMGQGNAQHAGYFGAVGASGQIPGQTDLELVQSLGHWRGAVANHAISANAA